MSHPNPSSPWGAPGHGQQPGVPQPGGQPGGAQPGAHPGQPQSGAQPGGVQNPGSTPDASYSGGQYGQPGGRAGQYGGQPGGQYPGGQSGQSAPGQESGYAGSPWGASGSGPQHGGEHGGAWQAQGSAPQEAGYGSAPQQPVYGSAPQQAGYGSAAQHPGQPNPGQGGQHGYGSAPQQPGYGSAPQQAGGFGGPNPGVPMPETVGKKAKGPKKPKAPGAGLIGPLTLRDILLLVAGLFALVALATPGFAVRVQGISGNAEWFVQRWSASTIGYVVLGVLPILAAAVLTLVNKLTGSIRLIGSLSVDQLISVLASVAFAMNFVWLATMAVSFHVGSVFGFLAAIIAFVAGTLTVIPVFGKEFAYRAATDAHPKARPYSKSGAAQGPVVGAQGGPNAQVAHVAQPGITGQEQGAGQAHGVGQAQAGSQPAGGFGSQPGSHFAPEQGSQPGSEFAPGQGSQPGVGADESASQPASGPSQPWAQPSGQQVTAGGGAGYGAGHGAFAPQNDSQSAGAQPGQAQHDVQAGQGETPGQPWAQQSQPGEQTSQPWAQNGGQPNQPGDHGQQDQSDKGQKDEGTFYTSDDEQAYLGRHSAKEPRYAQNQPTQAFMTGGKENQTSDQPGGPWAQSAATSGSAVGESHKTDASQNTDASQEADESQKADQSEAAAKSKDASEADGAEGAGSRSAGAAAGVAGAGVAAGVAGVAGAAGASDATGTTGAAGATGATGDAQPQNPWAKPGAPTEAGREHEVANTSGAGANAQDDAPREPDARGDAASRVADDNEPTQYFRPYEYSEQGFEPVDGSGDQRAGGHVAGQDGHGAGQAGGHAAGQDAGQNAGYGAHNVAPEDQETQLAHAVQPQQANEAQAPVSEPFWFAVPEPRPAVDETTGETVFMVTPGEWFLAQEDRGTSYVVHNSAQQEGIMHNVSDVILP